MTKNNKWILSLIVIFLLATFASASTPNSASMTEVSDMTKTVDYATGDMKLSLPLITLPGIDNGLSYDINLDYKAGIKVTDVDTWVGLGFNVPIPTITRNVRGVPDDYNPSKNPNTNVRIYQKATQHEYYMERESRKDWGSFWARIGPMIIPAIGAAFSGGLSTFAMQEFGQIASVINGPPTYYEYKTVAEEFNTDVTNYDIYGFFYLQRGDVSEENADYLLELNNPDQFVVDSPIYSGGLVYGTYGPLDSRSYGNEAYFCVLPEKPQGEILDIDSSNLAGSSPNNYCDNALSVKYILHNGNFDQIEMVSPDGIKMTFVPTVKVKKSHLRSTRFPESTNVIPPDVCPKLFNDALKEDYNYIEIDFNDEYVQVWSVESIQNTRNPNDKITFHYGNYIERRNSNPGGQELSDQSCVVNPDGTLSYTLSTVQEKQLVGIESTTYYALFDVSQDRTSHLVPLENGNPSPSLKKLSNISLFYKGADGLFNGGIGDDRRIEKVNFTYNSSTTTSLRQDGTLTLIGFQKCGIENKCFPKTTFSYTSNPLGGPKFFYNWDRWKDYCTSDGVYETMCRNGNHNSQGVYTYNNQSAWSLKTIVWPSGGSTTWEYEGDDYKYIGRINISKEFGGGIRVKNITSKNGLGNEKSVSFTYTNGAINFLPGTYENASSQDSYSKFGNGFNSPQVIYQTVRETPSGDNGYTEYSFTNAKDYPDKGRYNLPTYFYDDRGTNRYEFGMSTPKYKSKRIALPTREPFIMIAPEGDLLNFSMWEGIIYSYGHYVCYYTIQMPQDQDTDECDLPDGLVCKEVTINSCEMRPISSSRDPWNNPVHKVCPEIEGADDDTNTEDFVCPFMYSKKVNPTFNIDSPSSMQFYWGGLNYPSRRVENAHVQLQGYTIMVNFISDFLNPAYNLFCTSFTDMGGRTYCNLPSGFTETSCQDLDNNNKCDLLESNMVKPEQRQDFSGISFDSFRGKLKFKTVYNKDKAVVSYEEYVHDFFSDQFDFAGSGYFGFTNLQDYQFTIGTSGTSLSSINVFPASLWSEIIEKKGYVDSQESKTTFTYAPNGKTDNIVVNNIDADGALQQIITKYTYVGDQPGPECAQTDGPLTAGFPDGYSTNTGYHTYTGIIKKEILKGNAASDYVTSEYNIFDSANKCYQKENYAWREDSLNYGYPDPIEYRETQGEYVSRIESRETMFDRPTDIKDANKHDSFTYYSTTSTALCSGTIGPRLTCTKNELDQTTEYYYDDYNRVKVIKDENSKYTNYVYDSLGRLVWISGKGAKNLFNNPSAEFYLDSSSPSTGDLVNLRVSSDRSHSGQNSLQVYNGGWQQEKFLFNTPLGPQSEYHTYSVWILNEKKVAENPASIQVGLFGHCFRSDAASMPTPGTEFMIPNDGKWHQVYVKFRPSDYTHNTASDCYIYNPDSSMDLHWTTINDASTTTYFDDFQIETSDEPTPQATTYRYNYAVDECTSLDSNPSLGGRCMNWVQEKQQMGIDDEKTTRTYLDGLGRDIQIRKQKDPQAAIVISMAYNTQGLIDYVTSPMEQTASNWGKSDEEPETYQDDALVFQESSGEEDSIKVFYHNDPLFRRNKVFPISEYFAGDENEDCGNGNACKQIEYSINLIKNPGFEFSSNFSVTVHPETNMCSGSNGLKCNDIADDNYCKAIGFEGYIPNTGICSCPGDLITCATGSMADSPTDPLHGTCKIGFPWLWTHTLDCYGNPWKTGSLAIVSNAMAKTGSYSLKIQPVNGGPSNQASSQVYVNVEAGKRYILSAYIYRPSGVTYNTYLDLNDISNECHAIATIQGWTKVSCTYDNSITPKTQVMVRIVTDGINPSLPSFQPTYFDDITLSEIDCENGLSCKVETDELGNPTKISSDKVGNVAKIKNAILATQKSYYSPLGKLTNLIDFSGKTAQTNVYNTLGRLTSSTDPNNGQTTMTYDLKGNVETTTDANGLVIRNEYDGLDRLIKVKANGVLIKEYFYDLGSSGNSCSETTSLSSKGMLCEVKDYYYGTSTSYIHDKQGRITSVKETNGPFEKTISYELDFAGNILAIIAPTGDRITYDYNMLGQNDAITVDEEELGFQYNPRGLVSEIDYPGLTKVFSYTPRNLLESISAGSVFNEAYTYDDAGNLKTINNGVDFYYDQIGRLIYVNDGGYYDESGFSLQNIFYGLDFVGNRQQVTIQGTSPAISSLYTYYSNTDKLKTANGCTFAYDNTGKLFTKTCGTTVEEYSYDKSNMLERVKKNSMTLFRYKYSPDDKKVLKRDLNSGSLDLNTYYFYGVESMPLMTLEYCPGDFNHDGAVTILDVQNFGQVYYGSSPFNEEYDLADNGNTNIDTSDFGVFQKHLGQTSQWCKKDAANTSSKAALCAQICINPDLRGMKLCSCKNTRPEYVPFQVPDSDERILSGVNEQDGMITSFTQNKIAALVKATPAKAILIEEERLILPLEEVPIKEITLIETNDTNITFIDNITNMTELINTTDILLLNETNGTIGPQDTFEEDPIVEEITPINETIPINVTENVDPINETLPINLTEVEPLPTIDLLLNLTNSSEEVLNETAFNETLVELPLVEENALLVVPDPQSAVTIFVYSSNKLVLTKEGSSTRFYHQDGLNSNRVISDIVGAIVSRYKSLPFGVELMNTANHKFTYTGKEKDGEMIQMGVRFYDPKIGRFITTDPVRDNQAYAYANNNPYKFVDPDGKDAIIANYKGGRSPFGHSSMIVGNDETGWVAFWYGTAEIKEYINPLNIIYKETRPKILTGQGSTWQEALSDLESRGAARHDTSRIAQFETTLEQDLGMVKKIVDFYKNPGDYSVLGHNCANACAEVLEAGGIEVESKIVPGSFLSQAIKSALEWNQQQITDTLDTTNMDNTFPEIEVE